MISFGERLQSLRLDQDLSQKEFSGRIDVTPATISNYENDVHTPSIEKALKIADYFDASLDYLFGRSASTLSPSTWNQVIVDEITAGQFIQSVLTLTTERRRVLTLLVHDMIESMEAQQKT